MKEKNEIDISELRWDFFRGSGKGGQKRNKTDNCARCTHEESGASGKSEDGRSKEQNKKKALERMINSVRFKDWINEQFFNLFKEKRNFSIKIEDSKILINDLGKYVEPKRKEKKRLPSVKDKVKDDRRKVKKILKKFL